MEKDFGEVLLEDQNFIQGHFRASMFAVQGGYAGTAGIIAAWLAHVVFLKFPSLREAD